MSQYVERLEPMQPSSPAILSWTIVEGQLFPIQRGHLLRRELEEYPVLPPFLSHLGIKDQLTRLPFIDRSSLVPDQEVANYYLYC